jgi:hypothetical protein
VCEGLDHLCSCHYIGFIGLSTPRRFGGEIKKLISSWVLGTLDGSVALWCISGYCWEPPIKLWSVPQSQWISWDLQLSCGDLPKLCGASVAILGSLQLRCGDCPQLCTGPVTALKHPIVIGSSILVGGIEEITVSLCGIWEALCLHTAPMEISTRKSVNLGIHHCLHVPRLFLYPELLYL